MSVPDAVGAANADAAAEAQGDSAGSTPMPPLPPIPAAPDAGDGAEQAVASAAAPPPAAPASAYPSPYPYPYVYPGAPANPYPYGQSAAAAPGVNGAASARAPVPAPGYPAYPQGLPATYAPYPPAYYPYGMYGYPYPYGYPYAYPYPYVYPAYGYPVSWKPQRARGETHALVVSWIVTVLGGLSILCGLLVGAALTLVALTPTGESLGTLAELVELTIAPLLAGGFALYFGIRGILRKPSVRFRIPSSLLFLVLTVVVLGAGVVLWHVAPLPASPAPLLPLLYLSGILPAFTILAFTARRLGLPSTRRHVWMSLLYGLTLAPLLAVILEVVAALIIGAVTGVGSAALSVPANVPDTGLLVFILLLMASVVAPLVEEGVKPLGAVLLMRRLRTPASAFLLGMAAGVGFDITETIGYIGMGQADWIGVAIERVGAGLLHGVGAGMAALGWYYLINGKGISGRWWRGIGCIFYAVVQHAVFNGIFVVGVIPALGPWLAQPWYIGRLPFPNADFLDFALYVIILGVLYVVTGRLARGARPPATAVAAPDAGPPAETSDEMGPAAVGSGAR